MMELARLCRRIRHRMNCEGVANVGVDQVRMQYPNLTPLCKDTGAGPHSDTDRADNPGDGREKTSHTAIATMTV